VRPPPPVRAAARARQEARDHGDDTARDRLTAQIHAAGWLVSDTPDGYALEPRRSPELAAIPLAQHTTLRLGGPARRLAVAHTEADLVDALRGADASGEPVLILGGGSNVVVADEGFDGLVVQVATHGVERSDARVTVAAGEPWDDVVEQVVAEGLVGVEALAGIPGLVGATPIQNVGAYGQEVAQTIASVRVLDRRTGEVATMSADACRFTYRHSAFKGGHDHAVLAVTFDLHEAPAGGAVRYPALAAHLGVEVGATVPAAEVRAAVLDLRRAKGMVLDAADHDTWSVGSFFTNPVLDADEVAGLPAAAPRWPERDGQVKVSAAWLIEQAGFTKGYGAGPAQVSGKHTLALTNRGGATTADLLALAREIRDGVRDRFAVTLVQEPVLVGVTL
jgi:UDP-N-acetylmuramate dehydrogenase